MDTSFIPHLSRSTIKLYYTIVSHALRQVLVWCADVNTRHSRHSAKRQRRASESAVGLQYDHRPDYNSHSSERLFKQRELCKRARNDTLARLVPRTPIVTETLHHM